MMQIDEQTVGKTIKVKHLRKGEFWLQVSSVEDEWIHGILVSGEPRYLMDYNQVEEGENMSVRKSFLTVLGVAPEFTPGRAPGGFNGSDNARS